MLSEATFDQLVELPGVGPTRAQQFLKLREEAGGEVTGSWLCNIGGVDWKDLANSGKIVFKGEGADVGWVGNKGVLEWGNVREEVPMDTEKDTSKINEVDSKVEDRFLKHELQMQLMAEIWKERVHNKRCVAVGLDGSGRQWEWVVMGALLALYMGKPMVIHCRGY